MKEQLFETSAIFTKKVAGVEAEVDRKETEELINQIEEEIPEDIVRCIQLDFEVAPEANVALTTFFPDSKLSIIYNRHIDAYFAADVKDEVIYKVPMTDYEVLVITPEVIVIQAVVMFEEDLGQRYFLLGKDSYEVQDEFEYFIDGSDLVIGNKRYSLESRVEIGETTPDGLEEYFTPDYTFIRDGEYNLYVEKDMGDPETLLILNCQGGSTLGYYIELSMNLNPLIRGEEYEIVSRLTLMQMLLRNIKTGELMLFSARQQILLPVFDFGIKTPQDLTIENGVVVLVTKEGRASHRIHFFTPDHQSALIAGTPKWVTNVVGNGIYFPKDNVLVLDNGALVFTKPVDEHSLEIKGRVYELPILYLPEVKR